MRHAISQILIDEDNETLSNVSDFSVRGPNQKVFIKNDGSLLAANSYNFSSGYALGSHFNFISGNYKVKKQLLIVEDFWINQSKCWV